MLQSARLWDPAFIKGWGGILVAAILAILGVYTEVSESRANDRDHGARLDTVEAAIKEDDDDHHTERIESNTAAIKQVQLSVDEMVALFNEQAKIANAEAARAETRRSMTEELCRAGKLDPEEFECKLVKAAP